MAETTVRKPGSTTSSDFSVNGLLIGFLLWGLVIISIAIFIASLQTVQVEMKSLLGIKRGMLITLSFFLGLVCTTPFALQFEKASRD